jgi:hypothetical protein
MAITAYAISPALGAKLDAKTTAATFPVGMAVLASDGFTYLYVRADTAHASTANIIVASGASFSADTAASAGVANFVCRTTGGVAAGQYFWARAKKLAALS